MGLIDKIWVAIETRSREQPTRKPPSRPIVATPHIKTGNIFAIAKHRLDQQIRIRKQTGKPFFTSDLSTNEYLLVRQVGFDPIGLVMGTSFYHIGFYRNFWGYRNYTGEVEVLTQAQLAARELAMQRMQQEAALLGSHGVIGVRLKQSRKTWIPGVMEFTAIGTAIRKPGFPAAQNPFTSDLSGQEFWQLHQAGYHPKGLVFGVCSYYVHSDRATRQLTNASFWNRVFGQGRQNQEVVQFTQGFQDARELAILRLTEDVKLLGAEGAVGMQIEAQEEVFVYQPRSLWGLLFQLFFMGLFLSFFIAIFSGNSKAIVPLMNSLMNLLFPLLKSGGVFAIPVILFLISTLTSILNSLLGNVGPCKDLLVHFVAIGTAIQPDDEMPQQNPIGKTLLISPLNKRS
ncbi:Heavy metal-binding domain-containing protein [Tumidithrix helvetica PCC 7403]|uniref:heavy metal-binding domain-containing protein n=1 Tax=Tumidithrix helvetica TaxID=3457545 RepID=UPI003C999218